MSDEYSILLLQKTDFINFNTMEKFFLNPNLMEVDFRIETNS